MIRVHRQQVPTPKILLSARAAAAKKKAEEFFAPESSRDRLQRRFGFDSSLWIAARKPLAELFHGKCAYCESPLGAASTGEVEHFRPKTEAVGFDAQRKANIGKSARPQADNEGYWWLAYEWQNLYYVCEVCNRNKGNQFPVAGSRATPGTRGTALAAERALLLDPCLENPMRYLKFDDKGLVSPQPPPPEEAKLFHGYDRAAVTIELLGLNRPDLIEARRSTLREFRDRWLLLSRDKTFSSATAKQLRELLDRSLPYAGMRRQFGSDWIIALHEHTRSATRPRLLGFVKQHLPVASELLADIQRAKRRPSAKRPVRELASEKRETAARRRTVTPKFTGFIRSVSIKNFKAIGELKTKLPFGNSKTSVPQRGWKVLLGENGSGKSTILQALALALMGPEYVRKYLREFRMRPADLLRKVRGRRTVESATVEVSFSTGRKTIMQVTRHRILFPKAAPKDLFLRGYGATRLMPRRNLPTVRVRRAVPRNVNNLFNPSQPLFNVNRWMATLKRKDFGSAALSMKDLLNLPPQPDLNVEAGKVMVPLNGLRHPIEELSAGYESVLVMAADIMAGVMGTVHDFQHAPGIVLLDEIDAHLHPRWKMRIVDCLRRTFPSMQFVVSTHEPLCLRSVREKETLVVRRDKREVVCLDDLPSPSSLRVDQLLTSELFGLHSTLDPEVDEKFSRYYELLAKPPKQLTQTEESELKKLRGELPPVRAVELLGDNQREQLIYEMVDQYLAQRLVHRNQQASADLQAKLQSMREDVKRKLAKIWTSPRSLGGVVA